MSDSGHVEVERHRETYKGFVRGTIWSVVFIVALLALMAIFLL